jgi:hypothetical protein
MSFAHKDGVEQAVLVRSLDRTEQTNVLTFDFPNWRSLNDAEPDEGILPIGFTIPQSNANGFVISGQVYDYCNLHTLDAWSRDLLSIDHRQVEPVRLSGTTFSEIDCSLHRATSELFLYLNLKIQYGEFDRLTGSAVHPDLTSTLIQFQTVVRHVHVCEFAKAMLGSIIALRG